MADINNPKEFLNEALTLVDMIEADKLKYRQDSDNTEQLEKAFNTLKKNIDNEKKRTVDSRRSDVESEFNKKLKSKLQEIEKIEDKRSKARKEGVNNRVSDQTAGLKGEIKALKGQLKSYCSDNKMPTICKTRLFYRLYYPASVGDWLLVLVIAAVMIAAMVGAFVYGKLPVFIAVFAVEILIILIYAMLWGRTKGRYYEQLKYCRQLIANIRLDEKGVKNVTRNIVKDKSDEHYDLGAFDADIAAKRQEKEELEAQKTSALYNFDSVTKQQLIAEIDGNYADKLKASEAAFTEAKQAAEALKLKLSETDNRLNSEFVQYIGSRNLNHDTLTRLIELVEGNEAVSVSDAIAKLSETKDN